jgi:hypothetical protein
VEISRGTVQDFLCERLNGENTIGNIPAEGCERGPGVAATQLSSKLESTDRILQFKFAEWCREPG